MKGTEIILNYNTQKYAKQKGILPQIVSPNITLEQRKL